MNHKNEKGVAILLAVFGLAVMIFLAVDVAYDTQVEYLTASQNVNRLKAYYAAKAGVEISLLRISIYKQALAAAGPTLGEKAQTLLNPIWQFPLSWPLLVPDKVNSVDKDEILSTTKDSLMDSQYFVTIEGEGGKIDINDLDSPDEETAERIKTQLVEVFEQEKKNDEKFRDKYSNEDFGQLLDAMKDWIDEDTDPTGRGGGGESGAYTDRSKDTGGILPPNQPFKTLEELHMVAGMKDDFYKILAQRITVFGTKGINVNTAPDLVIKSLADDIDDEKMTKINERRTNPEKGGPFRDDEDFYSFMRSIGVNTQKIEELGTLLLYDAEFNFRIISAGKFANTRKEITAVTFDVDNISPALSKMLIEKDKKENPPPPPPVAPPPSGDKTKKSYKAPKGRPRVVYWQES